jgi:hypothetical protein
MRGVLPPTPSVLCHGFGAFNLLRLPLAVPLPSSSYLQFSFVSYTHTHTHFHRPLRIHVPFFLLHLLLHLPHAYLFRLPCHILKY